VSLFECSKRFWRVEEDGYYVSRVDSDHWDMMPLGNAIDLGTILSGDRYRLPGGRVIPRTMTLPDLEAFFEVDYG
jgi:hypothetical protein